MDKWHDIADDEVLDWCDKQMSDDEQTELSELLAWGFDSIRIWQSGLAR